MNQKLLMVLPMKLLMEEGNITSVENNNIEPVLTLMLDLGNSEQSHLKTENLPDGLHLRVWKGTLQCGL
jgi:hypothetical protein